LSQLTEFYHDEGGVDCEGRTLGQLLNYDDDALEYTHDVIQWLFPLKEPSNYNCDAPLLTKEDIEEFKKDSHLQYKMLWSFCRFLRFCGLRWDGKDIQFAENFNERRETVWARFNHNHLRITRVLKCLKTLGLDDLAEPFYDKLKEIYEWKKFKITPESFRRWTAKSVV
jgi:hypothetical protein